MRKQAESWEKVTAVVSGLVFILLLVVLSIKFPQPSPFQLKVFQTILALAAGAFGITLPGILHVEFRHGNKRWLQATGALALFIIVYFFNPAKLVDSGSAVLHVNGPAVSSGDRSPAISGDGNSVKYGGDERERRERHGSSK